MRLNRNKISSLSLAFSLLAGSSLAGDVVNTEKHDSICTHPIVWGDHGQILSWNKPEVNGAGYDYVLKLASEFIRDDVPVDPRTGLKLYYLYCELNGPESGASSYNGIGGSNNPACVFAGLTESLAVKYRIYSGDESYLQVVRECLDHMLQHGSSPSGWKWGNCPYSSSTNGDPNYSGCPDFGQGGGDGHYFLDHGGACLSESRARLCGCPGCKREGRELQQVALALQGTCKNGRHFGRILL
jgi:hypothetical protein